MILQGDCREVLPTLAAESVQCCVTSPPYWGLRDYGTAEWIGGETECKHESKAARRASRPASGLSGGTATVDAGTILGRICHCGAVREDSQIGLESTPAEYVSALVSVFRDVRRVLRPDGTIWLNLGDSYATGAGKVGEAPGGGAQGDRFKESYFGKNVNAPAGRGFTQPNRMPIPGLKPKDLVGIPWRVAFALQADGWFLRSDIIWHKPNPMPESVSDRPTKSHEYVFLLSKSERYFYDAEAIAEPSVSEHPSGNGYARPQSLSRGGRGQDKVWQPVETRNARSVWTIHTKPFSEAHFATFPVELARRCILAGSKPGDTVLDPFNGAGTTGLVAQEYHRDYLGIELKPEYVTISDRRLAQNVLPLLDS